MSDRDIASLHDMFDVARDTHSTFSNIPTKDRLHARPDICALLFLDRIGDGGPIMKDVGCEEIFLNVDPRRAAKVLTQDDVTYLWRCGVRYRADELILFV